MLQIQPLSYVLLAEGMVEDLAAEEVEGEAGGERSWSWNETTISLLSISGPAVTPTGGEGVCVCVCVFYS